MSTYTNNPTHKNSAPLPTPAQVRVLVTALLSERCFCVPKTPCWRCLEILWLDGAANRPNLTDQH